jgi:ABC-2 type transport system ATP-binding protein
MTAPTTEGDDAPMMTAHRNGARAATPDVKQAAILIEHLRARYGGQDVLRDISLAIPPGCVYGLVGPSGSGKTTLMRTILGLKRIGSGQVTVLGRPAGDAALRSLIGYMPQNAAIYPDLSARENLEFFGAIYGVSAERISETIELVELGDVSHRAVMTYSGGQRQRVALAAALLARPPLLVLDEPTVGLDPRLRNRLWTLFDEQAKAGVTLLVSTHVMDEAAHTDHLAFLVDGQLVATGTPAALLEQTGAPTLEAAVLQLTEERLGA